MKATSHGGKMELVNTQHAYSCNTQEIVMLISKLYYSYIRAQHQIVQRKLLVGKNRELFATLDYVSLRDST